MCVEECSLKIFAVSLNLKYKRFIKFNLQLAFWNNRTMSLMDMYGANGDSSEKCGEINFGLDYDFATQTLKLKIVQVSKTRDMNIDVSD